LNDESARALVDEIADWLRQNLATSGATRFVLGLSGGIDSAVVCGLCARAAGPERVLGAIMPSQSNPLDAEHAELVARTFGVATALIDLSGVTSAFLAAMPRLDPTKGEIAGETRPERAATLAVANVKPRLRMTTLYYLANLHNGIVVGTGNKSEAMVGYFTKYGDGGVDLLPIVDLYKHEVRALARALGVPEPVIAKAPSAGLWPGQTDESELGMSYDELDAALAAAESGSDAGVSPGTLDRVRKLTRGSEHKRRPAAAFRRAPSDSRAS
jgi:NAD+ synthase